MARLILLVASGTLLLCQTLATSATLGEDVDGSSGDSRDLAEVLPLTPFEKGSIEQEDKRLTRNVHSCGGSGCQTGFVGQEQLGGAAYPPPASSYPTYDTLHSQVPYPQPGPGPYPGYQPSPADQLQSDPYAGYQPYPADQPQPGSYPAYPPSPNYQPQPEPYPVYPPSQPYQPQPEPYPAYPNSPVYQPQPEPYPVYPPSPAVQPQPFPQQYYGGYPPQPPSAIQPSYPSPYPSSYSPTMPGQPNMMRRYIPGQVIRKYQCRQKVECGWQTQTTPGWWSYVPFNPTCPPRPCGNTPQPCYRQPPIVYPSPGIIYPPTPCHGHRDCNYGQQCCYQPTINNMACNMGFARPVRSQHHLQFNSTAASRSLVELMIFDWRDSDVTSFVIDLLLPLKVDLEHEIEVILRTDPEQSGSPCDPYDTDCIGPRILSCVADMWPVVTQPQAVAWSAHINTPFRLIPPSMDYQLEAGLQEPLANSTNALVNPSEEDSWSGGEPMEVVEVDPVASANQARQVRLLSFTACLLQSFGAGVVERKKSALLTAKRCVRAYKLQWPLVRACVALHDQGGAREGRGQDSPPKRPMEITVNGELAPDLDNLKLALCQALLKVGQAPILCDLLYDELDQLQKEPGLANTGEGGTAQISYEDQDSLSLRHTDSQGLDRGWNDHGLGFSHDLPRDQVQGEADREQDSFRVEASGTQEAYGEQNHDLNLKVRNGMEYRRVPEETEGRNVGYSKSRVSQSLDEVSASSPIWTGGPENPYEV